MAVKLKKLRLSNKNKMIGGVCGGIAEYYDLDSTVIRLIWAIIILFSMGMGVLAYLIFWIIMPER